MENLGETISASGIIFLAVAAALSFLPELNCPPSVVLGFAVLTLLSIPARYITEYKCGQYIKAINREADEKWRQDRAARAALKARASQLLRVACANKDGFTVDARTLQPVTSGFAVACKETQNSFGAAGLERVIKFVDAGGAQCFGGWMDQATGLYYWDATLIYTDRAAAIEAGRANDQIAIFDLGNLEEIRLDQADTKKDAE
jgi:hypothetical protein